MLLCFSCGLLILYDPDMLLSLHALNDHCLAAQVSSGHSESHCSSSFLSLIDLTLSGLIYGGWSVPFFHLISEDVIFRT